MVKKIDPESFRLYKELAEYYFAIEKEHRNIREEMNFLSKFMPLPDFSKVVDLGSGTGEHVHELHRMGYEAMGIDRSKSMLQVAQRRFPDSIFIEDDMCNLTFSGSFDAFFSVFGTLNYLFDDLLVKKTFRGVSQRLRSGGRFILEVWNAEPIRLIRHKPLANVSSTIYDGKVIHRNRGFRLLEDGARTMVKVDYLYQIDDEEMEDCHYMRAFYFKEIEELLRESGFSSQEVFGGYKGETLTQKSSRIVIVAKKLSV